MAELDQFTAANWAALGICYNSGQDCTAGSRVYVQESIYDKFLDLLISKVKAQVIGDGLDDKNGGGPVVRQPHQLPLATCLNYYTVHVANTRCLKANMTAFGVILRPVNRKARRSSLVVQRGPERAIMSTLLVSHLHSDCVDQLVDIVPCSFHGDPARHENREGISPSIICY